MVETSRFIWEPSREFIESTNVYRFIERLGIATSRDFIRYSQEHLDESWDHLGARTLYRAVRAKQRSPGRAARRGVDALVYRRQAEC
jgi:hypothetical protein